MWRHGEVVDAKRRIDLREGYLAMTVHLAICQSTSIGLGNEDGQRGWNVGGRM